MKIEEVAIEDLIPYERNNKIHDETQINRIANSIKEFWFLQPLVIDKNNVIVVWHWRVEWSKKLWLKTVPCVRAENLTPKQIKQYRILDNKLNESEYDYANLKTELDDLEEFKFWDLEMWVYEVFPELETQEFDESFIEWVEEKWSKKEMTEEQNEIFNEAYRNFIAEVLENQVLLLKKWIFDTSITKSASEVNFLKALFLWMKYDRYNNLAYHPHILNIKWHSYSLNEWLERTVNQEIKTERIRFTMQDSTDASKIYKNFLPFAWCRMPADFPVELAKEIYEKYWNKWKVLDMCHWRWWRVVWFMLSDCEEYVWYDPSELTYEWVKQIIERFNKYVNKKIRTENKCFEDSNEKEWYFDLWFTSPPYFDVEKYEWENQSRRKNKNFEERTKNFFTPLIEKTYKYLKEWWYMILQVWNQTYPLWTNAKTIAERTWFKFIEEYFSWMTNNLAWTTEEDGERIYIFKK